jgi:hypothetical protein
MGNKSKSFAVLIVVFLLIPMAPKYTTPTLSWQKNYGDNLAHSSNLIQTIDGGYAFLDLGWTRQGHFKPATLYKVDSSGNAQWNKTIEGLAANSIVQTYDGGYAILGTWSASFSILHIPTVIKLDSVGNLKWALNFTDQDNPKGLLQSPNGGFTIMIQSSVYEQGHTKSWASLIKTDSNAKIKANITISYPGNITSPNSIIQTSDQGYAIIGSTSFNGTNDTPDLYYWLAKLDSNGNLQFSREYGNGPGILNTNIKENLHAGLGLNRFTFGDNHATAVTQTPDGGFVVAGIIYFVSHSASSFESKTLLVKTDSQGIIEWNQTLDGYDVQSMILTSDGGLAYADSGRIIKTDSNYSKLWEKTLTYTGSDGTAALGLSSVIETFDGSLAVLGVGRDLFDNMLTGRIYLIKTNAFLPLPTPTTTSSIPEFPVWTISLLLSIMLVTAGLLVYHKRKAKPV